MLRKLKRSKMKQEVKAGIKAEGLSNNVLDKDFKDFPEFKGSLSNRYALVVKAGVGMRTRKEVARNV